MKAFHVRMGTYENGFVFGWMCLADDAKAYEDRTFRSRYYDSIDPYMVMRKEQLARYRRESEILAGRLLENVRR